MAENIKNGLKIGIMGGSFDPIHNGHLVLAEQIRTQFKLDKIFFIPAGNPPHKLGVAMSGKVDRYNMTKLAIETNKFFEISDIEIKKDVTTYTIETIRELTHLIGDQDKLYFITGADAILLIDTWKNYEELFKLLTFIGATRPGVSPEELHKKIAEIVNKYGADIRLTTVPALAISSTDIRNRVRTGQSIKYLLPESVEKYIYDHKLYCEEIL